MKNLVMVVAHKDYPVIEKVPYRTIVVGNNHVSIPNALYDNVEDNIAEKNPYYCELTALYWVWKNISHDYDNIGLCHYRRMFTKSLFSHAEKNLLSNELISTTLKEYDVILPCKFYWETSVAKLYYKIGEGREKDLRQTRDTIANLYPEYLESFDKVVNRNCASYCNMFIMSSESMQNYCEWLFNILFEVEKKTDLTGYTIQEKRIYGYLSEILLNVWIEKKQLRVKYFPMAYMETTWMEQARKSLRECIRKYILREKIVDNFAQNKGD